MKIARALVYRRAVDAATLGHLALDLAGLIPGFGEPADLTNALWYAFNGSYLESGLSFFAMIPTVGDAIAKPVKALWLSGQKLSRPLLEGMKNALPIFAEMMAKLSGHQVVGPLINKISGAVHKFILDQEKSYLVEETAQAIK